MAKRLRYPENKNIRFREGTLSRFEAVLEPGETVADAMRAGAMKELEFREEIARRAAAITRRREDKDDA